jgi:hypothetical protein
MNEFLFGLPEDRHEIINANDMTTAIRYFFARIQNPDVYVPDEYIRTDSEGHWVGSLHDHLGFIPEYKSDACIPIYLRERSMWKQIGKIALSDALKVNRSIIIGPRELPNRS